METDLILFQQTDTDGDQVQLIWTYLVYSAVRYFRHLLEGGTFYILTDHKPLWGAIQAGSDRYLPCETRHLDYLL